MLSISTYKDHVNQELLRQYTYWKPLAESVDPLFWNLLEEMERFIVRGGKRLRPYLLYVSYLGAGGDKEDDILPIAAGLEMLHNFLLIHDDILDRDVMRYGGPNIQGVYRSKLMKHFTPEQSTQFGEDIALIAGDVAHLLSSQSVLNSPLPAERKVEALKLIHHTTFRVAGGELVDVMLPFDLPDVSVTTDRVARLYSNKTAVYTFETPIRLGMILAGRSEADMTPITPFAEALGIAYQIMDDLLGVFGTSEETGKPVDSDIKEGKRTLLYYFAHQMLPASEFIAFQEVYGNANATDDEIAKLKKQLEKHGVKTRVEEVRDTYFAQAKEHMPQLRLEATATAALNKLIDKIEQRTS